MFSTSRRARNHDPVTMFRSKKDVDRHVRNLLNKLKGEDERKVRGYNIARLYFSVNEYESARRYLSEFLTVRPKAMDAHRLLGQIYEGLGNKEKAVMSYKTSYELGEGQKDLILKICELYTDVQADSSVRLYWAEEGHRLYPHHENVVKLREALLAGSGSHSREELEKLYLDEIKASPTVVRLQRNLLQLYKDWGAEDKNKLNEAYNYGCQVEARKAFSDSLEWYQTLYDVMQTYQNTTDVGNDVEFHTNYLSTLERLVYLTLASSSGTALLSQCTLTDAATLLHKFDQNLLTSLNVIGQNTQFGQLMVGQLYLHMAIFLMHSAKKDGLTHTSITAGALLFHACRIRAADSGHQSKSWTSRDQFWYKLACHRLSQAAHVLHHMAKTEAEKTQFLNKVKQQCSNREAQENIYQTLFGASCANKKDQSFFLNDEEFISAPLTYPEAEQVREWDNVVGSMYCASLGDMVWLCLQQGSSSVMKPQPYYIFTLFEGLQFSTTNVNTGAPETLCHLDLLAFLAATVYCQIAASKEAHGPPPASLPTVVASALNTPEQAEWWLAAYTLFTNRAHHRLSKLRMTLQRGLEVIRAHGNHGVDLALMAHLAQCFTMWASAAVEDGSTSSEIDALKDRAEHYWHHVLTLCQRAARNVTNIMPRNPLFCVQNVILTSKEREKIEEEGKYFLAMRLVHAGKQQEAIQALGELMSPEASFQRAMLYKERAQAVLGEGSLESVTSEMRSQHSILLTQARDTLYLTLDRLRMPGVDRFHPLNTKLSQQLEDVERRLSHMNLDQDVAAQREDDTESLSEASQSPRPDITNGHITNVTQTPQMFSTPYRDNRNTSRITRQEARPSPERLDVQVRALSEVQENILRNMDGQNAALRAQNEALRNLCSTMADEFKENSSLYRSMLEQNKTLSQEAYSSILSEIKQMHSTIKELQTQVHAMSLDLGELQALKSAVKQSEVAEVKTGEEQVPVDLPAAAVVHPGLYPSYMSYYNGQQPVPSPLMPTQGIFGNPPFFPPSTVPEQSFSMSTTVSQEPSISSLAQVSTSVVTSTLGSPASITVKEPLPSPSSISAAQSLPVSSLGSLGMNVATTITTAAIAGTNSSQISDASAPAHAFQITMPTVSNTLTPPPRPIPGEPLSLPLPCSTTAGLLANVPPPLYSAVTPDSSPVRGESHAQTVSTVLSTEGLATPSESLIAPTAAAGSQDSTLTFMGAFKSPVGRNVPKISPIKSKESVDDNNDHYVEDDHDPCPDFKPVVPLPEKVEVLTGEEDEEVLFENRARLYRYVNKEWRERGTGVMKLLHNPTQGSARVLMRRDQTHKICANHLITSNIELKPMNTGDTTWIWAAQDFADEELCMEKFCCRFKTAENAASFRDAFLKAKNIAKEKEDQSKQQQGTTEPPGEAANETSTTAKQPSLADMFKPAAGSWSCETCLVANTAEETKCVACETPNPNAPKAEDPVADAQSPYASFKFTPTNKTDGTAVASPIGFKCVGASSSSSIGNATLTNTPATTTGFSFKLGLGTTSMTSSPSVSTVPSFVSTDSTATITSRVSTTTSSVSTTTSDTSKEAGRFSLSGFTFTTTPSLKQEKVEEPQEEPQEEEKKKESVFAGFSFASGTANPPMPGFIFSTPTTDAKKDGDLTAGTTVASGGSLFGNKASSGTMLSFGSLATDTSTPSNLFTTNNKKAYEPKKFFENLPAKSPTKEDGEDRVEEYEPQVDFQPVVPMPDLVEVKTGEEGDEKLFCERSKLFRFDKETKEWKERGVGELKILKNIASGKVRVLMRRDQILKVCANHFITPKMKLTPMLSSDRAWSWAAPDFADEEVKEEQLAAKFKTQELALSFKAAFEKAQKSQEASSSVDVPANVSESTTQESFTSKTTSLAAMFKPAAGSWECQTCLVRNKAEISKCVSCGATKPGYESPGESTPAFGGSVNITETNKKEGGDHQEKKNDSAPLSLAGMFKPPAGSSLVRNTAEGCGAGGSELSVENILFGLGGRKNEGASLDMPSTAGGFSFGTTDNKPSFSFGIPQTSQVAMATTTQPPFTFGVTNRSLQETTTTDTAPAFSFCVPGDHGNKPFSFTWNPTNAATNLVSSTSSSSTSSTASAFSSALSSTGPEAASPGPQGDNSSPVKDGKSGFVFGSPGEYEFTFAGIKAKSPRSRDISVCESEDGVLEEDEGDHLYFEPVIPLPDKVEVITGEEEEEVLYTHRAKLFRLVAGEWKERGLGDLKILAHKQTGKIRLLMRREQVHKICLNHYLKKDMEFHKKDDKNFYWAALDYSETTPQNETFAIRFKTPEIASDFIKAVDSAKVKLGEKQTKPSAITSTPVKSVDDQENISPETVVIPKLEALSTSESTSTAVVAPADSTTPISASARSTGVLFGGTPGKSIIGGSPSSIFGTSGTPVPSIFGGTVSPQSVGIAVSSPSIFGGTATSSSSVFGGSSSFGTPAFTVNVSSNFSLKTPTQLGINNVSTASQGGGESSHAIEVLYEKKATPEQVEQARKLQLPDNFYLYKDAPPCSGCPGCKDESKSDEEDQETVAESASANKGITFKPSLFGSSSGMPFTRSVFEKLPSSSPSFGGSSASSSTNLLGESMSSIFNSSSPSNQNLFSGSTSSTPASISTFGNSTATTTSVSTFGNNAPTSTTNLLASNTAPGGSILFDGMPSSTMLFNPKPTESGRLFNTAYTTTTATTTESTTTDSTRKLTCGPLSNENSDSQVSFADLAAQASNTNIGQTNQATAAVWAARGQPVFSQSHKDEEGRADDTNAHDPHFEPIVPLPDLVEVKTGEEDLEVIFSNRGRLYRYDQAIKEWKERGTGDFKILYDRVNNKYRLLQRRELIHKTCCNHYLTPQLELHPLQTSETAWCWYATDYSDNLQGKNEQLAIRFKNIELAREFKRKFEECQKKLRDIEVSTSVTVVLPQPSQKSQKANKETVDNEDENYYEEEDDEDEDEDEEEDEDEDDDDDEEDGEDNVVIFNERCTLLKKEKESWTTLGMGVLRVKYDDDIYAARINMTSEDGEVLAEHIIATQTTMHKVGNAATWTVLNLKPEPSVKSTFKAEFSSSMALEEFSAAFIEGKEYAENAGIIEQPSGACGEIAPEELYYGQGADEQGLSKEQLMSQSGKGGIAKKVLPFSIQQLKTCDPNLTLDIVAALPEFISSQNLECQEE